MTRAACAYGGYVIQLAKAQGLTVIANASEKDEKLVASLGADIVVRRGDDVASRIREHFAWQRFIRRKERPMPVAGWRLMVREDGWSSNSNPGGQPAEPEQTVRSGALIEPVG